MKTFVITETDRPSDHFEAESMILIHDRVYRFKTKSLEDAMLHADEKRVSQASKILIHDNYLNLIAHRTPNCPWAYLLPDKTSWVYLLPDNVEEETDGTSSCREISGAELEDVRRKLEDSQDAFDVFEESHMPKVAADGPNQYMGDLENVRYKFVDLWDAFDCLEAVHRRVSGPPE